MARFKWEAVAPPPAPKPRWNDALNRVRVLHQLRGASDMATAWRLEHQIYLYALGCANCRTAYTHKAVQVLYLLEDHPAAVAALPDVTALPWMDEQDVHGTSATAACWEQCRQKWNVLHKLQGVQLEVPTDLQGGMRCRQCGSHDLHVEMRQTRSADEGMTAFITCAKCGHKW